MLSLRASALNLSQTFTFTGNKGERFHKKSFEAHPFCTILEVPLTSRRSLTAPASYRNHQVALNWFANVGFRERAPNALLSVCLRAGLKSSRPIFGDSPSTSHSTDSTDVHLCLDRRRERRKQEAGLDLSLSPFRSPTALQWAVYAM